MSIKIKERLIGVIVTLSTSIIMFLTYAYFGTLETKASSDSKYQNLLNKINLLLCFHDKKYCKDAILQNNNIKD